MNVFEDLPKYHTRLLTTHRWLEPVQLLSLKVAIMAKDNKLVLQVKGGHLVKEGSTRRRARNEDDEEVEQDHPDLGDEPDLGGLGDEPDSGSDLQSLLSDVDSGMETDAEAVGAEAGAAEVPDNHDVRPLDVLLPEGGDEEGLADGSRDGHRALRHVHTIWSNGLFTLSNDMNTSYVRVRMLPCCP